MGLKAVAHSGGGSGTISDITSTGGTITVTNSAGPTTNIEVTSGIYVPYTGATTTVDLNDQILQNVKHLTLGNPSGNNAQLIPLTDGSLQIQCDGNVIAEFQPSQTYGNIPMTVYGTNDQGLIVDTIDGSQGRLTMRRNGSDQFLFITFSDGTSGFESVGGDLGITSYGAINFSTFDMNFQGAQVRMNTGTGSGGNFLTMDGGTLYMTGGHLDMNTGGGSGGGNINMDSGSMLDIAIASWGVGGPASQPIDMYTPGEYDSSNPQIIIRGTNPSDTSNTLSIGVDDDSDDMSGYSWIEAGNALGLNPNGNQMFYGARYPNPYISTGFSIAAHNNQPALNIFDASTGVGSASGSLNMTYYDSYGYDASIDSYDHQYNSPRQLNLNPSGGAVTVGANGAPPSGVKFYLYSGIAQFNDDVYCSGNYWNQGNEGATGQLNDSLGFQCTVGGSPAYVSGGIIYT